MANYCDNFLVVSTTNDSDEALAQLEKFVSDVKIEGHSMNMEHAEIYRELAMGQVFEKAYRDNVELFIEHTEMSIVKFMVWVKSFKYNDETKTFVTGERPLSMEKLYPVPSELYDTSNDNFNTIVTEQFLKARHKKYGYKDAYDWKVSNWGCKHDLGEDTDFDDNEESVSYGFQTAWSPPTDFLMNIYENYPLLNFNIHYEEPGCNFEGDLIIDAGEIITNECREYSGSDDDDNEFE